VPDIIFSAFSMHTSDQLMIAPILEGWFSSNFKFLAKDPGEMPVAIFVCGQ
jgi:hypothetical protein